MVLANRLKIIISIVSFLVAGGCQSQTTHQENMFKMGEHLISITSDEKHCYLSIQQESGNRVETTLLSPPCALTTKDNSEILTYPYPAKSIDAVAIIVGNPISDEVRREWGIDNELMCGEKMQGILLKGSSISLSDWASEGGVWCPTSGMDEKNFYGFAHPETHKP